MLADRHRWDDRYAGADAAEPRPPDALVAAAVVDEVAVSGRALDVAAGLGPVSRWLARRGLHVTALDVSDVAIDAIRRCDEAAVIDADVVDLDDGLPPGLGRFEIVVCQRFRDVDVLAELPAAVAPGGLLVTTVLSSVGADSPGPFHAPPGELRALLGPASAGWDLVHDTEADGEASMILRRPADPAGAPT